MIFKEEYPFSSYINHVCWASTLGQFFSFHSVLGISWNIGFYYPSGILEIRGKKDEIILVLVSDSMGCFRTIGTGIGVLLRAFRNIGIGYC